MSATSHDLYLFCEAFLAMPLRRQKVSSLCTRAFHPNMGVTVVGQTYEGKDYVGDYGRARKRYSWLSSECNFVVDVYICDGKVAKTKTIKLVGNISTAEYLYTINALSSNA